MLESGHAGAGTNEENCWNRLLDLLQERIQDLAAMVVEVFFAATRELICWNRLLDLLDLAKFFVAAVSSDACVFVVTGVCFSCHR